MKPKRVLISGVGIAGPALAYWLVRLGYRCTLVERGARLREGGQAVDFRGPVHRAVLDRMGLWEAIGERRTPRVPLTFLDRDGGTAAVLPDFVTSGDVEILRGDLSHLLYDRVADDVETRFGDSIRSLNETGEAVEAELESGHRESFDLVIGAEGLRSRVRALTFPGEESVVHHGYRCVGFSAPRLVDGSRGTVVYSVPGRSVSVSSSSVLFVFAGPPWAENERNPQAAKEVVRRTYANDAWEVPQLLDALDRATDPYFDSIGTVDVPSYSRGRVALVGDAAYGGTLGGQGTPLALIGAYVLAGELARAAGDHRMAFSAYEARMRPFATGCQVGAKRAGGFHAPKTRVGLFLRNRMYGLLASPLFVSYFEKLVKKQASDFELPSYDLGESAAA